MASPFHPYKPPGLPDNRNQTQQWEQLWSAVPCPLINTVCPFPLLSSLQHSSPEVQMQSCISRLVKELTMRKTVPKHCLPARLRQSGSEWDLQVVAEDQALPTKIFNCFHFWFFFSTETKDTQSETQGKSEVYINCDNRVHQEYPSRCSLFPSLLEFPCAPEQLPPLHKAPTSLIPNTASMIL